ncbi:MAG: amidohydrolase family protein [Burkholderiales bacterium]
MHALVIRNGLLIDGTGAPRRMASVAVDGGRITAVGDDIGAGYRDIDAAGRLVTPGFVDIHTHYDGQALWDAYLTPSSVHGVTSAVFGNCGVGFAPVRPGAGSYLINLMEGVEDIPGTVLAEGVDFGWESFEEYMAALERRSHAIDFATQMPHSALRFYVMGERGADHAEMPTVDEIERMGVLLERALKAGALGFTTSRTTKHKARDGRLVPSLTAGDPELHGLAMAMRRAGKGVFEVNSDFGPGEYALLRAAAVTAGRPMSALLLQVGGNRGLWRETLAWVQSLRAEGLDATAQVGARGIGVLMGLETSMNPFSDHPAWAALEALPPPERLQRLREDGALRRRLIEGRPDTPRTQLMAEWLQRTFPLGPELDYEPDLTSAIGASAAASGTSPWAQALAHMMSSDGKAMLMYPIENYWDGSLETVREMLTAEGTVLGLADSGAHVGLICDGSQPTFLLSYWGRDRALGRIDLETLVAKLTRDTAAAYGLNDRGRIAPGMKADLNVIDFDALALLPPEVVYDLPAGGKRILQKARGYAHTFVSGIEILRDDGHTGELPGRLVRG